jgi:hypothetical protein
MDHQVDRVGHEDRHDNGSHPGMDMTPRATGPQVVTVGILSVLAQGVGILLGLLGTDPEICTRAIDYAPVAWFGLTVPSVAHVS